MSHSKTIAATWKNKSVAKARATHHSVIASGKTYRSTRAAFEALDLPLGTHIRFRMKLKAEKRCVYKVPNTRRQITFTIVQ